MKFIFLLCFLATNPILFCAAESIERYSDEEKLELFELCENIIEKNNLDDLQSLINAEPDIINLNIPN